MWDRKRLARSADRACACERLFDPRRSVVAQAMDLVHCASRPADRQRLYGCRSMSGDVAGFVRDKLGHEPADVRLFELALTHSSARRTSYERLEFLGDRVLGMVIAHA